MAKAKAKGSKSKSKAKKFDRAAAEKLGWRIEELRAEEELIEGGNERRRVVRASYIAEKQLPGSGVEREHAETRDKLLTKIEMREADRARRKPAEQIVAETLERESDAMNATSEGPVIHEGVITA